MKIFKARTWRGVSAVFIILLALVDFLGGWALANPNVINSGLNITTSRLVQTDEDVDSIYFKSEYGDISALYKDAEERTAAEVSLLTANLTALRADERAHSIQEMEEGAVLLKNDSNALPLTSAETQVTLFGHAVVQPLYRARSGGPDPNTDPNLVTFRGAMESAGFSINTTLFNAYQATYESGDSVRSGKEIGNNDGTAGWGFNTSYSLGEEPADFYTQSLKDTFADYNDVAIVMFAREGGETRDLPLNDAEGISHLALHQDEQDLLQMIEDSGEFDKTIVLINSPYAMELGWLYEYDIDAALWIGGAGTYGFEGVANILTGAANPSGRLVDTYASNSLSSPAIQNTGSFAYTNYDDVVAQTIDNESYTGYYVVMAEGIYTGYRYYETRYEDNILNRFGAGSVKGSSDGASWDYADEIVYPFGYGMSYTTFEETIDSISVGSDEITAVITVTNTGSVAGKRAVQLYAQTPYEQYEKDNLVEKSSVQLMGFEKTGMIAAGASEQVTITVDKYLLASYDYKTLKTYYLSEGDYYFAVGSDAHDALNNILSAKGATGMVDHNGTATNGNEDLVYKWILPFRDVESYSHSITGEQVTNRFDDADINYYTPNTVTYLSRQDWDSTYPEAVSVTATTEMINLINGYTYEKPANSLSVDDYTQGTDVTINFVTLKDIPFDGANEIWETFLNQLTIDEMVSILDDLFRTSEVASIGKPQQVNHDGPDGVQMNAFDGSQNTAYTNQVVLASTWNKELVQKRGEYIGEDALYSKTSQLWSPGANLHRTPFSGRNYEYYSEDATLSYIYSGIQTKAMTEKGLAVAIKHLAGNNFETNRYGASTWMTEQTWREASLRGFEGAYTIGGALSVMTSYTRIGATYVGASDAVNNQVMRGEWGFQGVNITDGVAGKDYQHAVESLVGGSDMFCINFGAQTAAPLIKTAIEDNDDGNLLALLRASNKNFYYAFSRTNLINGLTTNTTIEVITPWWIPTLKVTIGVVNTLAVASVGMLVTSVFFVKNGEFTFKTKKNAKA